MGLFSKKKTDLEEIATIDIPEHDYKVVIRGFDSSYKESGPTPNLFVRRYKVSLKFPSSESAEEFVSKCGFNPQAVQIDHSVNLTTIPGESEMVALTLDRISQDLLAKNYLLPFHESFDAIMADREKHQDKYGKPANIKKLGLFR